MSNFIFRRALALGLLAVAMATPITAALSATAQLNSLQVNTPTDEPAPQRWVLVERPVRLSESWLTVLPADAEQGYAMGAMWISPAARAAQRRQLRALLSQMARAPTTSDEQTQALVGLRQAIASMPITGRVKLPAQDPRWLQANPEHDPQLAQGDEWWLPQRPNLVRVWRSDGQRCDVPFQPVKATQGYLDACASAQPNSEASSAAAGAERAWLVQPDGRIQVIGLAAWNRSAQALPAPGAWIWAPQRAHAWPDSLSDQLASWLSTQGAAGAAPVPSAERLAVDGATAADSPSASVTIPTKALRNLPLSTSDWGVSGLLQTPSARTRPAGTFGVAISRAWPYTQYNLLLSPFDRMEVVVRYTNVSNALYGPAIAGDQSNKDKSAEVKWRLLDEGYWRPAVSVGLRDPAGTGKFAGEYLVASKRWGDWDASLGMAWGYPGLSADVGNPFAKLGLRSAQRQGSSTASGGTASFAAPFSGPTALFGGLQWHTPWDPLVAKLEWDGNDHASEPFGSPVPARSSLNAGLSWRWGDAEVGLSYQRGNRWSLNVAWLGSLPALHTPKTAVPRMPVVEELLFASASVNSVANSVANPGPNSMASRLPAAAPATGASAGVELPAAIPALVRAAVPNIVSVLNSSSDPQAQYTHALLVELAQHTGWHATRLQRSPQQWTAHFDQASGAHVQERIERVWAVLHREAPPEVTQLALEMASRQLPLLRHEIDRQAWAAARTRHIARHQQGVDGASEGRKPPLEPASPDAFAAAPADTPRLATGVNLTFQQQLGGPDGYLYAFSARAFGQVRAWSGAWLQGSVSLRLLDNYEHFKYTAPSNLPRVRTLQREFMTTRRLTLPNLQFTQAARLAPGWYGMVYGGWLEPMFAGVGGEVLYRPLGSPWAVGLDLNLVRQRGVEQDLALQDYRVATGHITLRWDTGWNDVVAGVSAGQYLAGDRGMTIDLARVFANGTRMGLWATKTNVSAEQFGEGSFDKGLYFSVPFDAMFTSWSGSAMTVAWQPLIRDGGAKLHRGASLWGLTELRDPRLQSWRSAPPTAGD